MEYKIHKLATNDPSLFARDINKLISEGWEPEGGIAVIAGDLNHTFLKAIHRKIRRVKVTKELCWQPLTTEKSGYPKKETHHIEGVVQRIGCRGGEYPTWVVCVEGFPPVQFHVSDKGPDYQSYLLAVTNVGDSVKLSFVQSRQTGLWELQDMVHSSLGTAIGFYESFKRPAKTS